MKKILTLITLMFLSASPNIYAHMIGGAYARLIKCEWGQYGYEYGNIGTYEVNGQTIKQFFGSNYCPA